MKKKNNYLEHHGIKGQRWGIRRYQNADGTLTNAGKKKMHRDSDKLNKKASQVEKYKNISNTYNMMANRATSRAFASESYGRNFNKIKQMRNTSKQFQRYAEFGAKRTNVYIKKLSKTYTVIYDVSSGKYKLRYKNE